MSAAKPPMPVVILISGRGTNMRVIAEAAARGALPIAIRAVICDQPAAAGLATAAAQGIATEVLAARDFTDRNAYDQALCALVRRHEPGLVVLAGFMRILSAPFVAAFADRILNIHPSLLPKHRGLNTHRRVLAAGEHLHGASVHFVTEELDGGPVIIRACTDVRPGDTEATLSARVQRLEHSIYPQAIHWFATGRLQLRNGRAWLDGAALAEPITWQS